MVIFCGILITMNAKKQAEEILKLADIQINGPRKWDIKVNNEKLFARVFREGTLGFGESYMDGWWDVESLDEFMAHIHAAGIRDHVRKNPLLLLWMIRQVVFNPQRVSKAFEVGEEHYDAGNDLYKAMLDDRMVYTCGYWKDATTLNEAQEAKLDLVCKKLGLKEGDRVLDIGCGWGSFMIYAAEKYGAICTGVTISKEQVKLGKERAGDLPVTFLLEDYRKIEGEFDHVVSLGMFEHVGVKNYGTFMDVVHKHLKDDGLFLLHTIGGFKSVKVTEPWIEKYIFPNSMLPSIAQIGKSIEKKFIMEDWHNFGADYDKTLMAWWENFDKAWPSLKSQYSDRFYRMWKYYIMSSAGGFRARKLALWQIVLSKNGVKGGYRRIS